jgi:lipopolysaccharide export system permease protein
MAGFAVLASRHEITAMRAAGISQWRLLAKVAPAALVLAAALGTLAEWVTPASQARLAGWWAATEPSRADTSAQSRWFRIADQIVHARAGARDGRALEGVEVYLRDRQGRLVERIEADRAVLDGGWQLRDVERTSYAGGRVERTRTDRLDWNVALQPEDVGAFFNDASALSAAGAQRALERTAPLARSELLFATRLHRSAAEPLAPLAMLLFAVPLAFVAPRTGRAWPALLYGGGAGLIYLVGDGILTVTAQVGYLPPLLGAWAAPVLAILIGLAVLVHTER